VALPHPTPAPGTARHLLLVPDEHHDDLVDAPPWLTSGMWLVLDWARKVYKLTHYGLVARGGDPAVTGALWRHAHLEVIVGDGTGPVHVEVSKLARAGVL